MSAWSPEIPPAERFNCSDRLRRRIRHFLECVASNNTANGINLIYTGWRIESVEVRQILQEVLENLLPIRRSAVLSFAGCDLRLQDGRIPSAQEGAAPAKTGWLMTMEDMKNQSRRLGL